MKGSPSLPYIIGLTFICVVGTGLRFRELDGPSLWIDELFALNSVMSNSWEQAMEKGHPIMGVTNYIFYHILNVFGHSDFNVRSISALSGVILILVVSEFGRKAHNEVAGLISAGMISGSFLAVRYSQEFTFYMMGTLFLWTGIFFATKNQKILLI